MKNISTDKFLQAIFGKGLSQVVLAKLKPSGGMYQCRPGDLNQRKTDAWYFCASTCETAEDRVRRRLVDFVAMHCIVLDDIGTKAPVPEGEPSWRAETSPGNWQYGYTLDEPIEDVTLAEQIMCGLSDAGRTDPAIRDAVHVFRIPGSWHKRTKFACRVEMSKRRFTWQEVMGDTPLGVARKKAQPRIENVGRVDVVDELLTWMLANGKVLREEDERVIVQCPNADEHTTGSGEAAYFPLGRGGDDNAAIRGFKCLHGHCTKVKFPDLMELYASEGAPECARYDPLPWLQDKYAIVAHGAKGQLVDLYAHGKGKWIYEMGAAALLQGFKGKMMTPDRDSPVMILTAFKEAKETTVFNDYGYEPGAPIAIDPLCNRWSPIEHPTTDATPKAFLRHIEWLVPVPEERRAFLDMLAYKAQHPDERPFSVMMVTDGVQGVGRSMLGGVLSKVWRGQAHDSDMAEILGIGYQNENYNGWMSECQLVIIEETQGQLSKQDGWDAYDKLKKRIDSRVGSVAIKRKGVEAVDEKIWFVALIFSNHTDGLVIDADDRRLMVIRNPDEPIGGEKGRQVAQDMDTEVAAIWHWLQRRDVSKFAPSSPPMTAAKRTMIEQTASPQARIMSWLEEHVEQDIISKSQFDMRMHQAAAHEDVPDKTLEAVRGNIWRSLPHLDPETKPGGTRFRVKNEQEVARILRSGAYWRSASQAERKAELGISTTGEKITHLKTGVKSRKTKGKDRNRK